MGTRYFSPARGLTWGSAGTGFRKTSGVFRVPLQGGGGGGGAVTISSLRIGNIVFEMKRNKFCYTTKSQKPFIVCSTGFYRNGMPRPVLHVHSAQ